MLLGYFICLCFVAAVWCEMLTFRIQMYGEIPLPIAVYSPGILLESAFCPRYFAPAGVKCSGNESNKFICVHRCLPYNITVNLHWVVGSIADYHSVWQMCCRNRYIYLAGYSLKCYQSWTAMKWTFLHGSARNAMTTTSAVRFSAISSHVSFYISTAAISLVRWYYSQKGNWIASYTAKSGVLK